MSAKSRGIAAERDLIHKFNESGWVAFRAAGSGSTKYPCPDLIAGNNARKVAVEVKRTTQKAQYFSREEIVDLRFFGERFGAEAWVAIKFFREPWLFVHVEDVQETPSAFVVKLDLARRRGLAFEEFLGEEKKNEGKGLALFPCVRVGPYLILSLPLSIACWKRLRSCSVCCGSFGLIAPWPGM
ncbi:MAG: hypothetical protein HC945_04485 [Nitrosarchaeum sp.]|nr:hypothetical protein [Nitrosarchaeum sp.]